MPIDLKRNVLLFFSVSISLGVPRETNEVIVYKVIMYANPLGHELYQEHTAYLFIIRRFWPNL